MTADLTPEAVDRLEALAKDAKQGADLRYIAAANPAIMLALIAEVRRLRQVEHRARRLANYWTTAGNSWRKAAAKQFLAALDGGEDV